VQRGIPLFYLLAVSKMAFNDENAGKHTQVKFVPDSHYFASALPAQPLHATAK
jgi:hypothetical protein